MIRKIIFLFIHSRILIHIKKLITYSTGDYVLISYLFERIKFVPILFIYLCLPLNQLLANESSDYLLIDMMVRSCYKDVKSCKEVLIEIHDYQKNAAINKKFSCQTRLLGLEANLIMASNSNFKRKEAKSIIGAIKKYC